MKYLIFFFFFLCIIFSAIGYCVRVCLCYLRRMVSSYLRDFLSVFNAIASVFIYSFFFFGYRTIYIRRGSRSKLEVVSVHPFFQHIAVRRSKLDYCSVASVSSMKVKMERRGTRRRLIHAILSRTMLDEARESRRGVGKPDEHGNITRASLSSTRFVD